jgi:hypothetical protein
LEGSTTRRQAGEGMVFADKMGLIEVAEFVTGRISPVGPTPISGASAGLGASSRHLDTASCRN